MQVSFRTIQLTDGKKRVNGALRARAAVRPALRQGSAFLLGLAGGWAVLYGALMPFGLGLTLGFAEDCFAVGAAGAALGVLARSFGTLTVETVVLLSHKKADSYIHIDVEFGEGEGKIPVDSIAKRAEAYKPKEKVTYKMIKEYIEAKYGFKVHTAYIAEVKRDLGLPMYDAPNAVEELKQPRKHPTPEKVEAIKDALRYFAVI